MKPMWINPNGYTDYPVPRHGWWERLTAREIVQFRLLDPPMTLLLPQGETCLLVQPDAVFDSDGASTPRFMWAVPGYSATAYQRSAYIHDSGYSSHKRHKGKHGLWTVEVAMRHVLEYQLISSANWPRLLLMHVKFKFTEMDRQRVDAIYRDGLPADDCPAYRAAIQYAFIRAFGPRW